MTSDELKKKIEKAGWTVAEFAAKIGKSERTVYRWLSGEVPIPKLVKLAFK